MYWKAIHLLWMATPVLTKPLPTAKSSFTIKTLLSAITCPNFLSSCYPDLLVAREIHFERANENLVLPQTLVSHSLCVG